MPKIIVHELKDWDHPNTSGYYDVLRKTIHVLNKDDMYDWILFHEMKHYERRTKFTTIMAAYSQSFPSILILLLCGIVGAIAGMFGNIFLMSLFLAPFFICFLSYYYEEVFVTGSAWRQFKHEKEISMVR